MYKLANGIRIYSFDIKAVKTNYMSLSNSRYKTLTSDYIYLGGYGNSGAY